MASGGLRARFISGPGGQKGDKGDQGLQGLPGAAGPTPWAPPVLWATGLICVASAPATLVYFGGSAYVCVATHVAGTFATDLAAGRWGLVSAAGIQPWQTPPVAWSASTGYSAIAPASCVTYQGSCYVCQTAHTSGVSFDATKWVQIAQGGSSSGGALIAADNLSDLASARTALANLGHAGSPVRQTVQSGPVAAGAPSFLPATSASLTLAFQNLSATSPLVLTCAKGFPDGAGAQDVGAVITANPSLTLPASATAYLYYDVDAGAWGSTPLQPLDQFGGAIATTSGQYTFDRQAMIGWVGNGSAAVRANRVFVAEAVTSASAVTSTIAYAYNGVYESAWTAGLPTAVSTVKAHNLGAMPMVRRMIAQCTATDSNSGYAVGDVLSSDAGLSALASSLAVSVPILPTRLTATVITGASGYATINKGSGAANSLTTANWQWKLVAQRGW